MSISNEKIRDNLARLRRRDAAGFFGDPQAHITNDRYLILAPGGTGGEIAVRLQQEMGETFLPTEILRKARVLAIDTEHTALDALEKDGSLSAGQVLKLPYEGVYESFSNNPLMQSFLPPNYRSFVRKQDGFDGSGASARPLNGRILLTSGPAVAALESRVDQVVRELMKPEFITGSPTLHVIFACSFCGGTGSGTIVDLAYMVRHILTKLSLQFDITCFALTPSACHNNTAEQANFIATLKTVQHYMNIHYTGGRFAHTYAPGFRVDSGENVFSGLYLIEGQRGGTLFENPHEEAVYTATRSILNNMIL